MRRLLACLTNGSNGFRQCWRKIIGLRNLLAYGYWVIDVEVWDVARNKVPELVAGLRPLLEQAE